MIFRGSERFFSAARSRASALSLSLLTASHVARAELVIASEEATPTSGAGVHYSAPEECPSAARFAAILAEKGEAALSIERTNFSEVRFELQAKRGGYDAAVLGTTTKGQPIERRVSGATCIEAAEALALIWTLVLRENRVTLVETTPSPPVLVPKPEPLANSEESSRTNADERNVGLEVRLLGAALLGRAPELEPAALLSLGLGFDGRSLFSPLIRLGASLGFETVTNVGDGRATFSSYLGRIDLCLLRAKLGSALVFRLCETNEGGALLARGSGFDVSREVTAKVFGLGALAAFELRAENGLGLELGFDAKAELLASEFELDRKVIFETPHASGGAYLGVRFDTFD